MFIVYLFIDGNHCLSVFMEIFDVRSCQAARARSLLIRRRRRRRRPYPRPPSLPPPSSCGGVCGLRSIIPLCSLSPPSLPPSFLPVVFCLPRIHYYVVCLRLVLGPIFAANCRFWCHRNPNLAHRYDLRGNGCTSYSACMQSTESLNTFAFNAAHIRSRLDRGLDP